MYQTAAQAGIFIKILKLYMETERYTDKLAKYIIFFVYQYIYHYEL